MDRILKKIITFSLIILSLASCDPAKLIIIKNKTDKPASFRWTVKIDSAAKSGHEFKAMNIVLGTTKADNESTIPFGFGAWPRQEVERFVDEQVKSIEIEGNETKISMTDKEEIKKYLLERRHGIFNNFITIEIN